MVKERNYALDIVRVCAFFCVVCVHFFLNSGFYSQPVTGKTMFFMCIMRSFFMICVPLFIILTGYLMSSKKWSGKYYLGIVKTLGIYVLASILCIIYKVHVLNTEITVKNAIFSILDFTGANYSWYIEMYIGLFLLIPFLNAMLRGLETRKAKLALVLTLISLSALPSVINIFNFDVVGWWAKPSLSVAYKSLVPDWWTMIYPITYYCIGAYLKEYPIKLKKRTIFPLWMLLVIAFGAFNFYRSRGGIFSWGKYTDWYSLPVTLMAILAFAFLSNIKTNKLPKFAKVSLKYLSDISLGAYLLSYIADSFIYKKLLLYVPQPLERVWWFVPTVLAVALLSLIGSAFINLIWSGLETSTKFIYSKIKNAKAQPISEAADDQAITSGEQEKIKTVFPTVEKAPHVKTSNRKFRKKPNPKEDEEI